METLPGSAVVRLVVRGAVVSIVAIGPQACTDSPHDSPSSATESPAVVELSVGALADSMENALVEREQELHRMRERAWRGPDPDPEVTYRRAIDSGLPVARPSPMQMDSARKAGRSEFMKARYLIRDLDRPLLLPTAEQERARICQHFGADILAQYDSTRTALLAAKLVLFRILPTLFYERVTSAEVKARDSVALQGASTALRQLSADIRRRGEQEPKLSGIDPSECTDL